MTAGQLLTNAEKSLALMIKAARADKALEAKTAKNKPFWAATKKVAQNLERAKKGLAAKNNDFFDAVGDARTAMREMKIAWDLTKSTNKAVVGHARKLGDALTVLRTDFSKEAARKKKGGPLSAKEKAQLEKMKAEQKRFQAQLKALEAKAAKDKALLRALKEMQRRADRIANAPMTVAGLVAALYLLDELQGYAYGYQYYVPGAWRTEWQEVTTYVETWETTESEFVTETSYEWSETETAVELEADEEVEATEEISDAEMENAGNFVDDESFEMTDAEEEEVAAEEVAPAEDDSSMDDESDDAGSDFDGDGDDDLGDNDGEDEGDGEAGDDESGDDASGDDDSGDDDGGDDDGGDDGGDDDGGEMVAMTAGMMAGKSKSPAKPRQRVRPSEFPSGIKRKHPRPAPQARGCSFAGTGRDGLAVDLLDALGNGVQGAVMFLRACRGSPVGKEKAFVIADHHDGQRNHGRAFLVVAAPRDVDRLHPIDFALVFLHRLLVDGHAFLAQEIDRFIDHGLDVIRIGRLDREIDFLVIGGRFDAVINLRDFPLLRECHRNKGLIFRQFVRAGLECRGQGDGKKKGQDAVFHVAVLVTLFPGSANRIRPEQKEPPGLSRSGSFAGMEVPISFAFPGACSSRP